MRMNKSIKDRMQDEVYRYEDQIAAQIDSGFSDDEIQWLLFFGSAKDIQNEQYF